MKRLHFLLPIFSVVLLGACSDNFLPNAGPTRAEINSGVGKEGMSRDIKIAPITPSIMRNLGKLEQNTSFSEVFAVTDQQNEYLLGNGDIVKVVLWETPPSLLFGGSVSLRDNEASIKSLDLPNQRINSDGTISIPFIGAVDAAGKTPQQLEKEIIKRLTGKANQPQALVQISDNQTKNVTLVGDFEKNIHLPLSSKGERLLDAVAAAGGARQAADKVSIQMTRGDIVRSMPMDKIIRDPAQNITLLPGDIVTAVYQPLSLSVLGATGKNEELNFETQGITLAQAMARVGGLQDQRADSSGVFIFRFENPDAFEQGGTAPHPAVKNDPVDIIDADGAAATAPIEKPARPTIPVIYTLNMTEPSSFFLAQNFRMKDKDILYVSNAPAADLQKFLNIISSATLSVIMPVNAFK